MRLRLTSSKTWKKPLLHACMLWSCPLSYEMVRSHKPSCRATAQRRAHMEAMVLRIIHDLTGVSLVWMRLS